MSESECEWECESECKSECESEWVWVSLSVSEYMT
jgi:hypothetical protein